MEEAAAVAAKGGMEYGGSGGVPKNASIAEIAPAAARKRGFGGGATRRGGDFQRGFFRGRLDRCRALEPKPRF
jgi:hypothetical protein